MAELKELVVRTRSGDLAAYGEIVHRFQDLVYGYAYSLLGDFDLAEDAAQEAFIQAWRNLAELRDPAAFPGWFRMVVWTECNRMMRDRRISTVPLAQAATAASTETRPADAAERAEMRDAVLSAIQSLPENERSVTVLFYIDGYSQDEIARFLDLPVTTVNGRLRTSRRQLKERIVAMVEDEFKKHQLPENFTQRVVTLAKILQAGVGRDYGFQFANGVSIRTRVDKVIEDERHVHLVICGPTEVRYHSDKAYPSSFDSFLLVPSTLVTVNEIRETGGPRLKEVAKPIAYGISGTKEPQFRDQAQYASLPAAKGPFDLAPRGEFGFIRLGGSQHPYEYHDLAGEQRIWHTADDDIYVHVTLIQEHRLKQGDMVECTWRPAVGNERYACAVEILSVKEAAPDADQQ